MYIVQAVLLLSFTYVHCRNNKTDGENEVGAEIISRASCEDYCENGGKCEIRDGVRFCNCKDGTSGDRCGVIVNCQIEKFCDPEEILKCVYDGKTGGTCECRESRKHFDSLIKKCRKTCTASNECENGAVCKSAGFSKEKFCQCHTGTSGDTCNFFEDCEKEKPCGLKSDVMCIKFGVAGGKCICNDTEKKFDPEFKECRKTCIESKDCEHNSVCERNRDVDEKFCRCKSGTAGDNCSTVINCEKENPCGLKSDVKCIYDILIGAGVCVCDDPIKVFDPPIKECHNRCDYKCGLDSSIECYGDQTTFIDTHCGCKIKTMVYNATERVCKNPCIQNPCKNGGGCYVKFGETSCRCKPGFRGNFCEKDPCYTNFCKNGGTCLVEGHAFKCVCSAEYTGETCDKGNEGNSWKTATILGIAAIIFVILLFGACIVFKIHVRLRKISRSSVV